MNLELDYAALRTRCLQQPGAEETWPFGPEVTVFKVRGKMFALCFPDGDPLRINLKCEPQIAEWLREEYSAIQPGYHMNKRHWNTITLGGDFPAERVLDQIENSYALVVKGLTKAERQALLSEA